jgi:hypothetical protein
MLFETYTKEVEIKGEKYLLRPLAGRFIGKLYSVIGKLQGSDEKDMLSKLDEDTMTKMYDICFETFKSSYPKEDESKVSAFVSQNLMKLIEPVITVNIGDQK